MTRYNVTYELRQGTLTLHSRIAATTRAPAWMVGMWFPDGPAGMLERLIGLEPGKE